jgi:hypothetical protein
MSGLLGNNYSTYITGLLQPVKRKVFISYHHRNDQYYYDLFSQYFSETLELFYDNSLDRSIDSTNAEYLNRKIREEYIFGTSTTILLCGSETWKRRWVDWEIHATLYYKHGLLGIILPTCTLSKDNKYIVSARLHENLQSGYAVLMSWTNEENLLKANIEEAVKNSNLSTSKICNSTAKMKKSFS